MPTIKSKLQFPLIHLLYVYGLCTLCISFTVYTAHKYSMKLDATIVLGIACIIVGYFVFVTYYEGFMGKNIANEMTHFFIFVVLFIAAIDNMPKTWNVVAIFMGIPVALIIYIIVIMAIEFVLAIADEKFQAYDWKAPTKCLILMVYGVAIIIFWHLGYILFSIMAYALTIALLTKLWICTIKKAPCDAQSDIISLNT